MSEVGAEQQLPVFGELLPAAQTGSNLGKAPFEELAGLRMASTEFGQHLLQQQADFRFGKGHDLRADFGRALVVREKKRTDQNARTVRMQGDVGALDVGGFHRVVGVKRRAD